jgi:hypothetical protein
MDSRNLAEEAEMLEPFVVVLTTFAVLQAAPINMLT